MIRWATALLALLVAMPALAAEITVWHSYKGAEEQALGFGEVLLVFLVGAEGGDGLGLKEA